jgi:deazaflavin-dependent oxidoreductase (nitroreductase family)
MNSPMSPAIQQALSHGHTIDITTTGRKTGDARRLEIVFHNIGGRIYISGMPNPDRKRGWLANLEADPHMTIHLKGPVTADLPAVARVITDPAERLPIIEYVAGVWHRDVATMQAYSPLIEVLIEGYTPALAA